MIIPRLDYVVIERLEDKQKGAIFIPDIAKQQSIRGKVLSVGPKVKEFKLVKPGAVVYFQSKWNDLASSHYQTDLPAHFDQKLHLVQEADIFMVQNG